MGEATATPTIAAELHTENGEYVLSAVPFKEHRDESSKLSFSV